MLNEENAMSKEVQNFVPVRYEKNFEKKLVSFLEKCLLQSGRALDINGRHSYYKDIEGSSRTQAHEFYKRLGYDVSKTQLRFVKEL